MSGRVQKIFGHLKNPADALVFVNSVEPMLDKSFFYVTEVASGLFEGCSAIGFPDGAVQMFSSPLEAQSARNVAGLKVEVFETLAQQGEMLRKLLPADGRLGLNYRELTYETFLRLQKDFPKAQFVDVSEAVRKARSIKDSKEVEKLREAGKVGSRVAEAIPSLLKVGMTELELAGEMEYLMCKHGANGRSFDTIVAFGEHGAEPHFSPTKTKLQKGQNMVCDFGALYQRYCSDITRSYAFGRPPADMKAIHRTVQEAQEAALAVIKAGVPAKQAHLAAAKVIDASPWKGKFIHGLGHSIGLAVHDGFALNPRIDDPLEAGMCVTVEPGIYVPGLGGVRIEDDILVTEKGYEWLTTAPRDYFEVGEA